ncbi:MAG: RagB/SusD family nutrient uptake outer membrane protein [Bacteroidales bacterium]|nr:RagB/SusD family nutrient uptake outer membrane protein [Bacteroidales bacterium]
MKKTIIFFLSAASLFMVSCSDFLTESSQDEIRPNKASDYKELIAGEVYQDNNYSSYHTWLDAMTDDVEDFIGSKTKPTILNPDNRGSGYGYFTWQQSPENQLEGVLNSDAAWAGYYHQILVANMILNDIDNVDGTETEKNLIKAESHMIRAFAYFMLVNLYGEPYDPEILPNAMGVPVNDLVGAQNKKFERESAADIYALITEDCKTAVELFEKDNYTTIYRWNKNAAKVFLSRVCLFTHDWDGVIKYAGEAIAEKPSLWNMEDKQNSDSSTSYFFSKGNPEILFSFGYYYSPYWTSGSAACYQASASLRAEYTTGDLRLNNTTGEYIRQLGSTGLLGAGKRYCPRKSYDSSDTSVHGKAIRNTEAYLNRAEAYAHKSGKESEALADLNNIRRNRIKAASYSELAGLSGNELLNAVKSERRRELCFEGFRWFDLRRWDRPRIVHSFAPSMAAKNDKLYFVLEKDDVAYTLPVPKEVILQDSDLENIKRPERQGLETNPDAGN